MPNWCSNYLSVSGDIPELVEKFYHFAKGKGLYWDKSGVTRNTDEKTETQALDFSQFLYPEGLDGSFSDVGYDWCVSHWGTKWNACDVACTWDDNPQCKHKFMVTYNFDTAWSPMSTELLQTMMRMFPSLTFEYEFNESGCAFYGSSDDDGEINVYSYLENDEMQKVIDKLFAIGYYSYDNMNEIKDTEEENKECNREEAYDELYEMYEGLIWDSNCDHEIDADELYKYIVEMWEFEKQTTLKSQ